ncbi:MAG: hypothetical protein JNM22_01985 [Saprospiraceae bacterium]|nr:hypothetical protein [Saprospiraceae bacterium]
MSDKRTISRRTNFLNRVIAVQVTYQEYKRPGLPDAWIYRHHIKPTYHISERTFREYLEIPATKELKTLQPEAHEC